MRFFLFGSWWHLQFVPTVLKFPMTSLGVGSVFIFSGPNLESNVCQLLENFLEYFMHNSCPFFSVLYFSVSPDPIFSRIFPLLSLLGRTFNFLILSLPPYRSLHFLLGFVCSLQFLSSFPSIQFFISAIMVLLPSAHFYSLRAPFYGILFLLNRSNMFPYPLEDINNISSFVLFFHLSPCTVCLHMLLFSCSLLCGFWLPHWRPPPSGSPLVLTAEGSCGLEHRAGTGI